MNLIKLLETYQRKWTCERDTTKQFVGFVSLNPDCFSRELKIGHITASAWLVNAAGSHVLLTHHRKLNRWLQLGGHADGNPETLEVALREAKEESGLTTIEPLTCEIFDIDIHRIPAHGDEPEHDHYDVRYALVAGGNEEYIVSAESHDLQWVRISEMEKMTDEESMVRMARKWERLRGPSDSGVIGRPPAEAQAGPRS